MDDYEDAARNIGEGIRHLRDLIEAERERQEGVGECGPSGQADAREHGRDRH